MCRRPSCLHRLRIDLLGQLAYLRWRTDWWDMMAHSSAEIGVVFGVLTLVTGSIWGRPTWQTWWEWAMSGW